MTSVSIITKITRNESTLISSKCIGTHKILVIFFQVLYFSKNRIINKMSSKIQTTHFFRLLNIENRSSQFSINTYTFFYKILFWQNALDIETTFTDIDSNWKKNIQSLTLTFFKVGKQDLCCYAIFNLSKNCRTCGLAIS